MQELIDEFINNDENSNVLVVTAFDGLNSKNLEEILTIECIEIMESYKLNNEITEEERNKVAKIIIHSLLKHNPTKMYYYNINNLNRLF